MKKTGLVLLILILLLFNFIIGANDKAFRVIPIGISMLLIIIYLIIYKIINKKNNIVFISKIDYIVFAFMLTTTLPLIFNTYASYSDTMEFLMKYFFIYEVYLLARNTLTDKKSIEIIISVTMIFSLIPVLLEMDFLNLQLFKNFMEWLDILYIPKSEFSGTFGYANAQAIYMCMCFFFAIHKFTNNKSKILKLFDLMFMIFALVIIFISKAEWIIIAICSILFVYSILKFKNTIIKNKILVSVILCVVIIGITIFMVIALNTPLDIVSEGKDIEQSIKYNFEEGNKYIIEFEIETINYDDIEKYKDNFAFNIQLLEGNNYFNEFVVKEQSIENYKGILKIEYTAQRTTDFLRIRIINNCCGYIKISGCKINGQNYILKYKFIPKEIGNLFSGFIFNGQSLKQRIYIYSDSIKIAKINPVFGNGGDAWKNLSSAVQDFPYEVKETHSYFFELLISYGIISVIVFLSFVIYLFVTIGKECIKNVDFRKENVFIFIGLCIALIHSITFDFDMSFIIIQLLIYIYIAVVLREDRELKNIRFLDAGVMCILILVFSLFVRAGIAKYVFKDNLWKQSEIAFYNKDYKYQFIIATMDDDDNYRMNLKRIEDFIEKEPYYYQTDVYQIYFKIVNKNINKVSNDELIEYFDFAIEKITNNKMKYKMNFKEVLKRENMLLNIITEIDKYSKQIDDAQRTSIIEEKLNIIKDIFYKEYEENIVNIRDVERNGMNDLEVKKIEIKYQDMLDTIKNL